MVKKNKKVLRKRGARKKQKCFSFAQLRGTIQITKGTVFGIALCVVLGGYVFVMNTVAVKGGDIKALERKISTLHVQNEELGLVEADLRSLVQPNDESSLEAIPQEEVIIVLAVKEDDAVAIKANTKEKEEVSVIIALSR